MKVWWIIVFALSSVGVIPWFSGNNALALAAAVRPMKTNPPTAEQEPALPSHPVPHVVTMIGTGPQIVAGVVHSDDTPTHHQDTRSIVEEDFNSVDALFTEDLYDGYPDKSNAPLSSYRFKRAAGDSTTTTTPSPGDSARALPNQKMPRPFNLNPPPPPDPQTFQPSFFGLVSNTNTGTFGKPTFGQNFMGPPPLVPTESKTSPEQAMPKTPPPQQPPQPFPQQQQPPQKEPRQERQTNQQMQTPEQQMPQQQMPQQQMPQQQMPQQQMPQQQMPQQQMPQQQMSQHQTLKQEQPRQERQTPQQKMPPQTPQQQTPQQQTPQQQTSQQQTSQQQTPQQDQTGQERQPPGLTTTKDDFRRNVGTGVPIQQPPAMSFSPAGVMPPMQLPMNQQQVPFGMDHAMPFFTSPFGMSPLFNAPPTTPFNVFTFLPGRGGIFLSNIPTPSMSFPSQPPGSPMSLPLQPSGLPASVPPQTPGSPTSLPTKPTGLPTATPVQPTGSQTAGAEISPRITRDAADNNDTTTTSAPSTESPIHSTTPSTFSFDQMARASPPKTGDITGNPVPPQQGPPINHAPPSPFMPSPQTMPFLFNPFFNPFFIPNLAPFVFPNSAQMFPQQPMDHFTSSSFAMPPPQQPFPTQMPMPNFIPKPFQARADPNAPPPPPPPFEATTLLPPTTPMMMSPTTEKM